MIYVKSGDGTRLAVYDPNPSGRPCVLLIHGWPLSHEMYEYQEEFLLSRGVRVVTMDLRGFGNSDAPASGYDYNQMADDVFCVVRHLRLGTFSLGGFSMGGAVALRYMKNYAGYGVGRLMLFAAAAPGFVRRPGFPYGISRERADALIEGAMTDRPALCRTFCEEQMCACPHSPAFTGWLENICLSASGWGTVKAAVALRDENGEDDLSHVSVPTAVFAGEKDQVVPADLTALQAHRIRQSVFWRFEDCGHGIFWDAPEEFNRKMAEFLLL